MENPGLSAIFNISKAGHKDILSLQYLKNWVDQIYGTKLIVGPTTFIPTKITKKKNCANYATHTTRDTYNVQVKYSL